MPLRRSNQLRRARGNASRLESRSTCDPERKSQHSEPKKIGTLSSDEHHLAYGRENVDKLITNLKLLKRFEFTETLQDGYGLWTITAY
jgi:hypothetical protein